MARYALLFALVMLFLPAAYASPFVLSIDASHNDGTQMGVFIGEAVKKKFPNVEKQYDNFLAFLLSPAQYQQLVPQVEALKAVVAPAYQAEVNAIATTWQLNTVDKLGDDKLSITEFWLLQLLPDLTAVNKGSAFATINRSDKNPIVARNLDWKTTQDLKNLQSISIYHYKERTLVNIGFAGLVSVINGFNDQGLFVSLIDASELQTANAVLAKHASGFELRSTLMVMDKIMPATQALAQKLYPRNQQILLADPENIAVLEQPAVQTGISRQTDSTLVNEMPWYNGQQLAVVNCFVLKTSPHNCYASQDHYQWERFAQLSKAFFEQVLSVSQVAHLMQDQMNSQQAIFNQDTLQAIVFTPKDRVLYFSISADRQVNDQNPLLEKYQFIKISKPGSNYKSIAVVLLVAVGILVLVWIYVFPINRANKQPASLK
jgi:hypothetical protein